MKILLLIESFNSLSQGVYVKLKDMNMNVFVVIAINDTQMLSEIKKFNPNIILCPFLNKYIPSSIYENYPTYIFHPAPRGDRGANSLEYAISSNAKKWGVVILKANEAYDGGDIYASSDFTMRDTYKASLYRNEVVSSFLKALDLFFINLKDNKSIPQILNPISSKFTQEKRAINWDKDSTNTIIKKIHLSDSSPGVKDNILGTPCYLYGAHKEDKLRGKQKEILAKRDGAVCLGTIDGAVWISHLKEINKFKLPSTYVLKDKLKGIKEERIPLIFDKSYNTFYELSIDTKDNVVYLSFNFHNGAMDVSQCIRLKYAVEYLKDEYNTIVLMGGEDFFSNGIHLNILEDSKKQGEDGWANINAMNDLISSIIYADDVITIASLSKNAGAGGVFIALACDYVVAMENIVLNPHYKTLNLSGSEYHSFSLVKRVGENEAKKLLNDALPISVNKAKKLHLIDEVFPCEDYQNNLHNFAMSKYNDDFIWKKQEYLEENKDNIQAHKEREISKMYAEFWDENSSFHTSRKAFVYKTPPLKTPQRLQYA